MFSIVTSLGYFFVSDFENKSDIDVLDPKKQTFFYGRDRGIHGKLFSRLGVIRETTILQRTTRSLELGIV